MTAVAPPVQLQQPQRPGWAPSAAAGVSTNGSQNGVGSNTTMTGAQEESAASARPFMSGPRKPPVAQRTNSSSSISSTSSSGSTLSAASTSSSAGTNGTNGVAADNWATRKKPARGLWPPGKSEPISGLSTARPQSVSSSGGGGQTAASGLSALHTPLLPSQQMANGTAQQAGAVRNAPPAEGSAFLYLLPINGTFERKTIHVPLYPDVLRIGRQTNAKTAPTPTNGFFDSKVLSRQHAEVYAERTGRVFIRDVKSSNGTFVNGKRLSPENKESEPHELREQDVLELGIDIVSEDQKTVVHHKVAARVEHAGVYAPNGEIGFGDLDPSGGGFMSAQQMKRVGGPHPGMPGPKSGAQMTGPPGMMQQQQQQQQHQYQQPWQRMWVQPISTEQLVKRLNRELSLAKQQQQEMTRVQQSMENILSGKGQQNEEDEKKAKSDDLAPGSTSKQTDMDSFPQPPALPPPSHPLPDKPELISKSMTEAIIQPFLQRSYTARPKSLELGNKGEQVQALSILSHELKAAKDQIPNLQERVRALEQQLRDERSLRESAEERAQRLERRSSGTKNKSSRDTLLSRTMSEKDQRAEDEAMANLTRDIEVKRAAAQDEMQSLSMMEEMSTRIRSLQASMTDMKAQMEAYRRRAEVAESQRDEARQSLVDMVEEKRTRLESDHKRKTSPLSHRKHRGSRSPPARQFSADGRPIKTEPDGDNAKNMYDADGEASEEANGQTIRPAVQPRIPLTTLLSKAGLECGDEKAFARPLTRQQAVELHKVLRREMQLSPDDTAEGALVLGGRWGRGGDGLAYHGLPHAIALSTVVLGLCVMRWFDGWEKVGLGAGSGGQR